jgi:hypothetical protein
MMEVLRRVDRSKHFGSYRLGLTNSSRLLSLPTSTDVGVRIVFRVPQNQSTDEIELTDVGINMLVRGVVWQIHSLRYDGNT